jgi:two-component system, OmpR family, sensor histidine kinase KdpD
MNIDANNRDPGKILDSIKRDEFRNSRGKLKIFFGMAAGVGKTYAMLEYAHRLKKEGVDVVVGYIETHGRTDTARLVEGFEVIPRKKMEYRELLFEEMDFDAIIRRKPRAVLIDELAHTNISGSLHPKRYLDVLEILDYGIDVYTTLNIQHLESYSSIVEEITGVRVQETLPDLMLEYAERIELIDITPEELLKRLEEGKVYTTDKAGIARDNFFKKENLTALREISLRYTAKKVDRQLEEILKDKSKLRKTVDKLLVAVSPSPYSQYLIKWTKRISYDLKTDWIALYVEKKTKLNDKESELLKKNLDLARELGAEVLITNDEDVVKGILRIAEQKNITQIIVGKSIKRTVRETIFNLNITDRLINNSGDIAVYVVTEPGKKKVQRKKISINIESSATEYLLTLLTIFCASIINLLINRVAGYWTIGLIYLFVVSIIAIFFGRGPVLFAAALSALTWNFFFIPPRFTLFIGNVDDLLMFVMYFIIALITGNLTSRLHLKEQALRIREKNISELYEISSSINNISDIGGLIRISVSLTDKFIGTKTVFILKNSCGQLNEKTHDESTFVINEKEYTVASWCFNNKKQSGKFTDTLPLSGGYYLPLLGADGIYGVVGFDLGGIVVLDLELENFIKAVVRLVSIAIERIYLIEKTQNYRISEESNRLYNIILNSISHELRTPLTLITNSVSGMLDERLFSDEEIRTTLLNDIVESTERMNGIVGNLLDMVRIESGKLRLNLEWNDIGDIVGSVIKRLSGRLSKFDFTRDVPSDLPLIFADFGLIEQVLINLLVNAMQHNVPGIRIHLKVHVSENSVFFIVKDGGVGIKEGYIERIFEKFYRGERSKTGGTGLGLSICKAIVELHNGKIYAQNNDDSGVSFMFFLPINKYPEVKE